MQSLLSNRSSIVDFVTIEAKSCGDNAVLNKHCCDNSKHVSTEIPVLDRHSFAVSGTQHKSFGPSFTVKEV
jgi:hypothetical protein